jgi:hypothetical protein
LPVVSQQGEAALEARWQQVEVSVL